MKTLATLAIKLAWLTALMLTLAYAVNAHTIHGIRFKQLDNSRLMISCGHGADPAIKAADSYNTIIVTCATE